MQITAGFITLAVCGLLAVAVPSLAGVWRLWRKGGVMRALAVIGCVFIVMLAILAYAGMENIPHQWEEATLSFLLIWGVSFYALLGCSAAALVLKRVLGLTRRSSGAPTAPAEL